MRGFFLAILGLFVVAPVWAGPYSTGGIAWDDPAIIGWATSVGSLVRGPQSLANPAGPLASYGVAANALGVADGVLGVVSLGDGGQITVSFTRPIHDGPGADFAVFENGFTFDGGHFGELAFVEVSGDGISFIRFPATSLTPTSTQLGPFDPLDPSNINNLAGKHAALVGTPFDLAELGLDCVTYVRLVDVVGSIDPAYQQFDKDGNPINDPWPTDFASGGFDLDAVAVLHDCPEPAALPLTLLGLVIGGGFRCRKRQTAK